METIRPTLLALVVLGAAALVSAMPAAGQEVTYDLSGTPAPPDQGPAQAGDTDTVTVRLHGKLQLFLGGYAQSDANTAYFQDGATGYALSAPFAVSPSGAVEPLTAAGPGARVALPGRVSLPSLRVADLGRIYPGFDGVTAGGLQYGATVDLGIVNVGQGDGGLYGQALAPGRVSDRPQVRRAWAYVGLDGWGNLRVGATEGPSDLFMTGNFERFNSGGWNGAVPYSFSRQWNTIWPFPDVEAEYTTPKIVYVSPRRAGFDVAVSFEPSGASIMGDERSGCASAPLSYGGRTVGAVTQAGSGCDFAASGGLLPGGVLAERRDTVEAALRYRGQIGEVGLAAYADYTGSAAVRTSGTPAPVRQAYQGLSVGYAGAQVYYAGLTVGGMVMGGTINDTAASMGLQPGGTGPQTAFLLGASYAIGPATIGASYFSTWQAGYQTAATATTVGTYNAQGVAAGGTWSVTPYLSVYLEYLWGQQKQNGYNLDLLSAGGAHNKIDLQYVGLGTGLSW